MTLILINGYAGAGKDTFVKFFTEEAERNDKRVVNLSSITPVWDMLKELGIDMDLKRPIERKLAAEVKAALDNYDFYATRMVLETAHSKFVHEADYVFVHMREPRALEYSCNYWSRYANQFSLRTLFINREQQKLAFGNIADDSVSHYPYQDNISNFGSLEDFKEAAISYFYHLRMLP